jgi:hypothetical protein
MYGKEYPHPLRNYDLGSFTFNCWFPRSQELSLFRGSRYVKDKIRDSFEPPPKKQPALLTRQVREREPVETLFLPLEKLIQLGAVKLAVV